MILNKSILFFIMTIPLMLVGMEDTLYRLGVRNGHDLINSSSSGEEGGEEQPPDEEQHPDNDDDITFPVLLPPPVVAGQHSTSSLTSSPSNGEPEEQDVPDDGHPLRIFTQITFSYKCNNFTLKDKMISFLKGFGKGIFCATYLSAGLACLYTFFNSKKHSIQIKFGVGALFSLITSYCAYVSDFFIFSPNFSNWCRDKKANYLETKIKEIEKIPTLVKRLKRQWVPIIKNLDSLSRLNNEERDNTALEYEKKASNNSQNIQLLESEQASNFVTRYELTQKYQLPLHRSRLYKKLYFRMYKTILGKVLQQDLTYQQIGYYAGLVSTTIVANTLLYRLNKRYLI